MAFKVVYLIYVLNYIHWCSSVILFSQENNIFFLDILTLYILFSDDGKQLFSGRPLKRPLKRIHRCSYEVSRSLAACEGALLVVDASQGVEAQTLANVWLAMENNLTIIPVINKIDLPGAEPDKVIAEIEEILGIDCSNALLCSAKTGVGIEAILEAVVHRIPPPPDNRIKPLRALIFDSFYDPFLGIVCQFRVMDGMITKRDTIRFMNTQKEYAVRTMS